MLNNTSLSKFVKTTDTSTGNNILNKLKDINLNSFQDGFLPKLLTIFQYLNSLDITSVFDGNKTSLGNLTSKNLLNYQTN